jgi:DNA-binding CsgD family transcriptional regulator
MDDPELLRAELVAAERGQRKVPGVVPVIDRARHRLALLDGAPSDVSPELSARRVDWGLTTSTLWTLARETIDAGEPQIALDGVRALAEPTPSQQAVVALVAGAATGDEDAWHRALRFALDRGARAFAVDALEGLACAAARSESWQESLRLLAAAERLRRETRYRWRFECEQRAVDDARAAAVAALDRDGADAIVEGAALDWREAGAYAQRARGERKRPSHGWASLTPTEEQVVALVAEGLTNSAIADRLFIGTATVKTHLVHVFAKLGVRTRAELAAAAARRERGPAGPAR